MALDPQFPADPFVYVLYTHDAPIGGTAPRWGTAGVTSDPCPNPPGGNASREAPQTTRSTQPTGRRTS
jgi:hypothetical protein